MPTIRLPNSCVVGTALSVVRPINPTANMLNSVLSANVATATELGVVQVGSGLTITSQGVLSATASGTGIVPVTLTAVDYTVLATDYYVGAIDNLITIVLPIGVVGQTFVIKNQVNGNITVTGTGGQQLDTADSKQLGAQAGFVVIFDGTRWNII